MSVDFTSRKQAYIPPERPEWVRRINEEGGYMDIGGIVPLDENSLLATARANTGLHDFGPEDWITPFRRLIAALDGEAQLNLMGRIMTRSDLLLFLEARLHIQDSYTRHPEIAEERIEKPLLIIGQGRSGTSALLNLLSHDPDNGTLKTWEVLFPGPPPEAATYRNDPRIAKADRLILQPTRVVPELAHTHEWGGDIPTETVHLRCLAFMAPYWLDSTLGQTPSYTEWVVGQDFTPAFEYEKKVLKLLQWKNPRRNWILKDPISINHLPEIVKVYPDIGLTWIHRDPVKSLASMVSMIGGLTYVRSDSPFIAGFDVNTEGNAVAASMARPIDWINAGAVPAERLCNVHYADFVEDPIKVAEHIYAHFGIPMTARGHVAMQAYVDGNPRSARPAHRYSAGPDDLVAAERNVFARYQAHFDVPVEL